MGKITKNYIYNLIYQLFIMVVPLVTAPYLAHVLGADRVGSYGYVHSMTGIITTFSLLGIYAYGNRQVAYVRDDKQKLSTTFWQIMSARCVIAVFGTIAYFMIVLYMNRYVELFTIYYTYLLAYFLDCTWLYVGVEDMKWAVIKNTLTKVFAVMGIFLFVKSPDDLCIYVFIQGLSLLLSNLLAYTQLRLYVGCPKFDLSNFKVDISGAFLLFLPSIATTIYTQCDKIMIELMTNDTAEVAFYDYSEKIVTIPLTFITVMSTVMMPRIANEFKNKNIGVISDLINQSARISMFLAFPMTFGLIFIAGKLVPWYLGDQFLPTTLAIILISPIIITNTLTGISGGQYFTATNQIKILVSSQFSAALANIMINALLIPKMGFYGAAIATTVTSICCAIVQYMFLIKQIKLYKLGFYMVKYGIIAAIMGIVVFIVTDPMLATPFTNIIQVLLGGVVYVGCCVLIRDEQAMFVLNKALLILRKKH